MHLWVTLTQWPLYSTSLARIAQARSWFLHSDRRTDSPLGLVSPWLPTRRLMFPVWSKPVLWLKVLGTSVWTGIWGLQTLSELLVTFSHYIQHLEPCRLSPTGFSIPMDPASLTTRTSGKEGEAGNAPRSSLIALRKWQSTPVFLPGESPWTEEPGGLQSIGSHRVRHDWGDLAPTHLPAPCLGPYIPFSPQSRQLWDCGVSEPWAFKGIEAAFGAIHLAWSWEDGRQDRKEGKWGPVEKRGTRGWLYLRSQVSPWGRLPSERPWPPAGKNPRASHSKVKVDLFREIHTLWRGFSGSAVVKNLPASAEDAGSIPGSGRSPRVGNGNPLCMFYLENRMDRGAWRTTAHRVSKSWTPPGTAAQRHIL